VTVFGHVEASGSKMTIASTFDIPLVAVLHERPTSRSGSNFLSAIQSLDRCRDLEGKAASAGV
jgi:hypothetical protein